MGQEGAADVEARKTLDSVFREEHGRIIAGLIRMSGSFEKAEEAMQDAFAAALVAWPEKGIPLNPAAWITAAAHRKLIDESRRERTRRDKADPLRYETLVRQQTEPVFAEHEAMHLPDDRLKLIFTCCHPALNQDAQIALTLRTLGGLTTTEIARAFLIPEPTLAQRLIRAKRKIEEKRLPYRVPDPKELPERLQSVQAVIYLIFNEGYGAGAGDDLLRVDLCNEAIRLARVLVQLLPEDAESLGLLALMLLHHSRRDARTKDGELVTLEGQDRSLWRRGEVEDGVRVLDGAIAFHNGGPYQIQAAIAALHATAKTASETDWRQIVALYRELLALNPSPVIALNHAVATAMADGAEAGLKLLDELELSGDLKKYYLLHAARADLLRRMERWAEAGEAYEAALALANNTVEQKFLTKRLGEVRAAAAAK